MTRGDVVDERGHALTPGSPYRPASKIFYYRSLATEQRIPFEASIIYQDDHIVVVDKPHFLPVTPAGRYVQETLLVRLKKQLGIEALAPVHRLDRETAGLVLFTKRADLREPYHAPFRLRQVHKTYEAIAPWRADLQFPILRHTRLAESAMFMQWQEVPGEANAKTCIELMQHDGQWARYRLRPTTGLKHQLRVHMAALGLPIRGDRIYPILQAPSAADALPDYSSPLQLLAKSLAFTDPMSGHPHLFESRQHLTWIG